MYKNNVSKKSVLCQRYKNITIFKLQICMENFPMALQNIEDEMK